MMIRTSWVGTVRLGEHRTTKFRSTELYLANEIGISLLSGAVLAKLDICELRSTHDYVLSEGLICGRRTVVTPGPMPSAV